jgi:hypothetical protein
MADITRQEWCLLAPSDREMVGPAIATLPSLTNISRTSLFCSKLREGGASDEASAFKKNEALNPNSKQPAVLFHKKDLRSSDESALDSELRNAIESPQQQVVGVVVNAVDDHLAESDQLVIRWTQERVRALPMLLHEARLADRVVVLLSDHGHVIDHGAKELPGDGGERWRSSAHTPESGEVKIVGPRVMTPDNAIVAPWSESIRYKPRKNGYHGGVNPQEMVIPIAVLSSGTEVEGWSEQLHVPPDWWHESEQNVVPEQSVAASFAPPKPKDRLFHMDAEERQPEQIWLKLLGSSELLETQRSLAGRNVPSTEDIARVVSLFDERGGKLTTVALSRHLNTPAYRLSGLLAKLQRVLNLDGYGVLSRDEDSGTVELNLELLCTQFGLRS